MKELEVKDIVNDDINPNAGTESGMEMLGNSIDRLGYGRSILLDKNNHVISGNKTLEKAIEKGLVKVVVVETDGTQLVAVKRTDTDLDSKEGREMALADNAVAKANLSWDREALDKLSEEFGVDRSDWGLERAAAQQATEKERKAFDAAKRPPLICPYCYEEFELEDYEHEEE